MEKKVLPKPAVAGVLAKSYVEARLHTDREIPGIEHIRELQEKYAESIANPIYVTVDAKDETRLSRFNGATLTAGDEARFVEFLRSSLGPRVVQR